MNCYFHANLRAVGICVECGKPVCDDCVVEFENKYYCKYCVHEVEMRREHEVESRFEQKTRPLREPDRETTSMRYQSNPTRPYAEERNWLVAILLSIFVGFLGVDRFYLGKVGTGLLKLFTFGGFFVWWLIDLILIATGEMKDVNGNPLKKP